MNVRNLGGMTEGGRGATTVAYPLPSVQYESAVPPLAQKWKRRSSSEASFYRMVSHSVEISLGSPLSTLQHLLRFL